MWQDDDWRAAGQVAGAAMAEVGVSLVNLQILDADGVLLLVFAKGADRDRARKILGGHFPEVGQN